MFAPVGAAAAAAAAGSSRKQQQEEAAKEEAAARGSSSRKKQHSKRQQQQQAAEAQVTARKQASRQAGKQPAYSPFKHRSNIYKYFKKIAAMQELNFFQAHGSKTMTCYTRFDI